LVSRATILSVETLWVYIGLISCLSALTKIIKTVVVLNSYDVEIIQFACHFGKIKVKYMIIEAKHSSHCLNTNLFHLCGFDINAFMHCLTFNFIL